jgi:hypothetical protein
VSSHESIVFDSPSLGSVYFNSSGSTAPERTPTPSLGTSGVSTVRAKS